MLKGKRRLRELVEHRAEQERQRAEQAEDLTRRTTFEELLESCHYLFQYMLVQKDKSLRFQKRFYQRQDLIPFDRMIEAAGIHGWERPELRFVKFTSHKPSAHDSDCNKKVVQGTKFSFYFSFSSPRLSAPSYFEAAFDDSAADEPILDKAVPLTESSSLSST